MNHRVKFSTYSIVVTAVTFVALVVLSIYLVSAGRDVASYIVDAAVVFLCTAALFYAPISISADDDGLYINRGMCVKLIPMSDIESIKLCPPTMGERRICGSGGWFGYWGWYSERDLGKYFAYYGKASDCFLVTLTDGSKYMLGCRDPKKIVDYIQNRISK